MAQPYEIDILARARENSDFRRELLTGDYSQVSLVSLPPGGETGEEVHEGDQFLVITDGQAEAVVGTMRRPVGPGAVLFFPARLTHILVNTGTSDLKAVAIYAPAVDQPGTVYHTREDSDAAEAKEYARTPAGFADDRPELRPGNEAELSPASRSAGKE